MGDEGQPSAVAERGSFVVIGYLLWQLSRISAVWPAEIGTIRTLADSLIRTELVSPDA